MLASSRALLSAIGALSPSALPSLAALLRLQSAGSQAASSLQQQHGQQHRRAAGCHTAATSDVPATPPQPHAAGHAAQHSGSIGTADARVRRLAWQQQQQQRRPASGSAGSSAAGGGGGGTTAADAFNVISVELGLARIDGVLDDGFIVSDVQVEGGLLASGDFFALWAPRRWADVTLESLALLRLLKPPPDLLVLGCGARPQRLPEALAAALHDMGVRVDATDTASAAATFNILNQEGRKVVGALLPSGVAE